MSNFVKLIVVQFKSAINWSKLKPAYLSKTWIFNVTQVTFSPYCAPGISIFCPKFAKLVYQLMPAVNQSITFREFKVSWKIAKMALIMIFCFVITWLPNCILSLAFMFRPDALKVRVHCFSFHYLWSLGQDGLIFNACFIKSSHNCYTHF